MEPATYELARQQGTMLEYYLQRSRERQISVILRFPIGGFLRRRPQKHRVHSVLIFLPQSTPGAPSAALQSPPRRSFTPSRSVLSGPRLIHEESGPTAVGLFSTREIWTTTKEGTIPATQSERSLSTRCPFFQQLA